MAIGNLNMGAAPQDDEQYQRMLQAMLTAQSRGATDQFQEAQAAQPISMVSPQQPAQLPALPSAPTPDVSMAHASLADQPATQDVARAQSQLDHFQNRPIWQRAIVPALIGAASVAGAHSWGGKQLQANAQQDTQDYIGTMKGRQQSLIQQLEFAKQQQNAQYEADQRNRQQDILMAGNNQAKQLMGQIAAQSRQGVAQTAADSRRDVADTNTGGKVKVAEMQDTSREGVADEANKTKLSVARINADAALNRFLAGQGREDARQQNAFSHADNKPTADEDRRADLSQALIGYATEMKEIAQKRPDLWGPLAGRLTRARQFIGTNDPDVANMKRLREQIGIVQMGAHSMRSAQAIAPIADSVVSSFNSSPEAAIAALDGAIKGVSTFTGPQIRPDVVGGRSLPPSPLAPRVSPKPKTAAGPEVWVRGPDGTLRPQSSPAGGR